ncbi:hypothetical protein WICPIJ_000114 [Wickerhamomyces pijperi]|uniref:Nucleoside transporter FUN26 n=1 Tax=Wickerhamomyces pijperi TaxID=599730 RepID=A0A9P8TSF5_WICPI|nr:hypothetical protein WICPIJ_000114 [Wickerhamomyces pijperi]
MSKSPITPYKSPPVVHYESLPRLHEDLQGHSRSSSQSNIRQTASNSQESVIQFHQEDILLFQIRNYQFKLSDLKYATYVIIGISLLWPWNCFLSASQYFMTKFQHGSTPELSNLYTSTMMTVSTLSSLCFNSYLSTLQIGTNYSRRVAVGIVVNFVIFVMLTVLESTFPNLSSMGYFIFIMFLVLSSSVATCLQQNGTMAIVNIMGAKYAQGVMVGQAIAGVLPSIALIVSNLSTATLNLKYIQEGTLEIMKKKKISESSNKSIVIYFGMTCLVMIVSGILFSLVNRYQNVNELLQHQKVQEHVEQHGTDEEAQLEEEEAYVPFMVLFHKLKYIACSIFTIFIVTLVFPIFASNISSIHKGQAEGGSVLYDDIIFIPFVFLIWNIGDLAGRMLCSYPSLVLTSDRAMFQYSLARFLIIPLFLFSNLPSTTDTPIINSDLFYVFVQFIFGLTNGHCLSCCFMNVGSYVDSDDEKKAAAGFTTVFLSLGLLFGSLVSYFFVGLVR